MKETDPIPEPVEPAAAVVEPGLPGPPPPPPPIVRSRIPALDVLRGCALLGILVMNIQSFSLIFAAYMNPTAYGDLNGVNLWAWFLSHVFADQKFMTLFSMLFGAGVVLMTGKVDAGGGRPAGTHYRRMFWLLLIGLAHAYLLWFGDILVAYALCGSVVFLFRRVRPGWLLTWGLAAIMIPSLIFLAAGLTQPFWDREILESMTQDWRPGPEAVAWELAIYRGGWSDQMVHRVPTAFAFQTEIFLLWGAWRAGGLMLMGMALLKWGVLTAERSTAFYRALFLSGLTLGLPLILAGVIYNVATDWSVTTSMFHGMQFNYWGSLPVSLAYLALIMRWVKSGRFPGLQSLLAGVGRMALTQYLAQTLICTTLFYGHGLGWFGRVDRWQMVALVAVVWLLQLAFAAVWFRRFRQGPCEWLWRSLTYLRVEPLRRERSGPSTSGP